MKPEAQRIAIAEAVDFEITRIEYDSEGEIHRVWADTPITWSGKDVRPWLPDFLNSHDAMHEAILTLTPEQLEQMWAVLTSDVIGWGSYERDWVVLKATSQQLAEAFLKTVKRWEP